jgi:hypothetical protein
MRLQNQSFAMKDRLWLPALPAGQSLHVRLDNSTQSYRGGACCCRTVKKVGTLITTIIKAGSLGKNTSLVHSDADIVVFVRNIKNGECELQHTKSELLTWLAQLLREQLPQLQVIGVRTHLVVMRLAVQSPDVNDSGTNAHVDIDLLVARDFCPGAPTPGLQACLTVQHIERIGDNNNANKRALQRSLGPLAGVSKADWDFLKDNIREKVVTMSERIKSVDSRHRAELAELSVCVTEAQKIFVKAQPQMVNMFIRLLKQRILQNSAPLSLIVGGSSITVNMKEHAKQQGINSYLMELLAVWTVQAEDSEQGCCAGLTLHLVAMNHL